MPPKMKIADDLHKYSLTDSNARFIAFEDRTYPVDAGIVWMTEAQAKPFLEAGAIQTISEQQPPEASSAQPALDLPV